ncbi:nitrate reductase associated protein [Cupriavidus sp. 2TAF22]|uniref:nitrate reductase associated protein n=1 Tax=unclassified Cupriavidus TaxID=2640874 RepID=UPI003F921FF7
MFLYEKLPLFVFEIEACDNLKYVPMCLRFNLDFYGYTFSLLEWQALPVEAREALAGFPPATAGNAGDFASSLRDIMQKHLNKVPETFPPDAQAAWLQASKIPDSVLAQYALAELAPITGEAWSGLSILKRYVLTKMSLRGVRNHCFVPALLEFGLVRSGIADA